MNLMKFLLHAVLYLLLSATTGSIVWSEGKHHRTNRRSKIRQLRVLQTDPNAVPYYSTNDAAKLGVPNLTAATGNPLKGLAGGPRYSRSSPLPNSVPSAIEFYNIGLDEIMVGDNLFNWTLHDQFLSESESRRMHAVLSVYIHWPGRPLRLPPHLLDITLYDTNNGKSPNYGDPRLLTALQQFIVAWGKNTDGDTRVAAIHVGLLGFWGEGHTYPDLTLVPETSKQSVAQWYRQYFNRTQIQARYPGPNADGFGLYDGSLAYTTLDGEANGGETVSWYMYPQMLQANQQDTWRQHIMGGETRPELQKIIFSDTYPVRTVNHQDYQECIDALHISYALHHDAFQDGGYSGSMLQKANTIHAYMGYAFYVSQVSVYLSEAQAVNILVDITQLGVAPFYYDLSLVLECNGDILQSMNGVNEIVQKGESKRFMFKDVPGTKECLDDIKLALKSSYAYDGRPIRFAQGSDGTVSFSVPLAPPDSVHAPVVAPVQAQTPLLAPRPTVPAPAQVIPTAQAPSPTKVAPPPAPVSVPRIVPPAPVPLPIVVPSPIVGATPVFRGVPEPEASVPVTAPRTPQSLFESLIQLILSRLQFFLDSMRSWMG